MATRSAKLYQGEDMLPVIDYTDSVIWEESEFGTRAWQGEGSASTVVIRDPLGEQGSAASLPSGLTMKSLASKNLFVIDLGNDIMFRGRVGIKNYSRDGQQTERYRQVEVQLHDTHWDLDHIFVHNYARPSETGNARIQGVMASYLSGSPRPTTDLNGSNFLSGSNTVVLPAQTFKRTTPLAIIRETALSENKQFFITGGTLGGGSMFYDGNDSTIYPAGIRISDRPNEIDTSIEGCEDAIPLVESVAGDENSSDNLWIQADVASGSGRALYCFTLSDAEPDVTWRPAFLSAGTPGASGGTFTLVDSQVVNGTHTLRLFRLLDPPSSIEPTSSVEIYRASGVRVIGGVWSLTGVSSSISIAKNTGTGSSSSVTGTAGDLIIEVAAWSDPNVTVVTPAETGDNTERFAITIDRTFGFHDYAMGGADGTDSTPSWGFTNSYTWAAMAVTLTSSTGGSEGADLATFPPIWNVGPASTEDGSEQLCEVVLFYGSGGEQYVTAHDLVVHTDRKSVV